MSPPAHSNDDVAEEALAELTDAMTAALNQGQTPPLEEYCRRYPDWTGEIRKIYRMLVLLGDGEPGSGARQPNAAERIARRLGDYRIKREIGRGGMGVVYEAEQISLGRRVALKTLPMAAALDRRQLQRFRNEARSAAALDHPHVVSVHAVGCERGVHYYAMQYIEGCTLAEMIAELSAEERGEARGRPSLSEVTQTLLSRNLPAQQPSALDATAEERPGLFASAQVAETPTSDAAASAHRSTRNRQYFRSIAELGIQAADALEHAHQLGIVHRDIKPSNLLVDGRGHLCVADFGLAQVETDANLTMSGDILGTLRYMSPEQARGDRGVLDSRTDIYSLGVTLYELLTLRPAFPQRDRGRLLQQVLQEEPPRPRQVDSSVPLDLETIVLKAMAKEPSERYGNAAALAEDLQNFLECRPIRAKRPTLLGRAAKWSKRRSGLVAAVAAILAVTTLALSLSTAYVSRSNVAVRGALDVAEASSREAMESSRRAQQQEQRAIRQAELTRQLLYASDLRLAGQAWARGDAAQVAEILPRHVPGRGETDLRGFEWHFLSAATAVPHVDLIIEDEPIYFVCFAPDGKRLAAAGQSGVVRIHDAANFQQVQAISTGQGEVNGVAFDPTGRELASAGDDGTLRIWDLASGNARLTIPAFSGLAYQVAFSPDGKLLASCGNDAVIRLWDPVTGEAKGTLEGHEKSVEAIAISASGDWLASAGSDCLVRVWDLARREAMQTWGHAVRGRFSSVAFSPDEAFVAAGSIGGDVFAWDAVEGEELCHHRNADAVQSVAFSHDGESIIAGDRGGMVKVWPVEEGTSGGGAWRPLAVRPAWQAHAGRVYALAVSPDGKQVVSAGGDGHVVAWTPMQSAMRELVQIEWGSPWRLHALAFQPASGCLLVADGDRGVCRFNCASGGQSVLPTTTGGDWRAVAVSPDGNLAAGGAEGEVLLCDPKGESALAEWGIDQAGPICFLRFFADGSRLAAVGLEQSKQVNVFDVSNRQRLPPILMDAAVDTMESCPLGRSLLLGVQNRLLVVEPESHRVSRTLVGHTDTPNSLATSPAAPLVASVGNDRRLILWDAATGEQRFSSLGGAGDLHAVAFSHNARTLATAGAGGIVKLWHVPTRQALLELPFAERRLPKVVNELAFSPDGRRLAVRFEHGEVLILGVGQ